MHHSGDFGHRFEIETRRVRAKISDPIAEVHPSGLSICIESYDRERWGLFSGLLSTSELEVLRLEAATLLDSKSFHDVEELCDRGCSYDPMEDVVANVKPDHPVRYELGVYLEHRYRKPGPLDHMTENVQHIQIFRDLIAAKLASAAKAAMKCGEVFLFNEHFVIKPPHSLVSFGEHTDENEQLAGAASLSQSNLSVACASYPEYVSFWVALDDTDEDNGGLTINGLESAEGDAKTLEVDAGSAVLFSSKLRHCSGPNQTSSARRVYYVQFSPCQINGRRSIWALCFAVRISGLGEQAEAGPNKKITSGT
jgi:hypothetical protein